jgi:Tol biopolymer transport system component
MAYLIRQLALACGMIALAPPAASLAGELFAPGVVSSALQETSATFTPDGGTVYFMRSDFTSSNTTILQSRRSTGGWSTPQVAPFSGQWHDSEPALSPDGKRLYFVSNRPPREGAAPVIAQLRGQSFPGTNLWYVERDGDSWSAPVHVDGQINHGSMLYNPSLASNGDLYFSAHREDSGSAYQIYVAPRGGQGHAAPRRLELGDIKNNRMDPSVDPAGRFLVYAGNEGDSLGSADIYIVFREADGRWGKPVHLGDGVNSPALENAPALGRAFGELYVTSQRGAEISFPKPRDDYASLMKALDAPLNGSRNIWRFDISAVLRAHGIQS